MTIKDKYKNKKVFDAPRKTKALVWRVLHFE